MKELTPYEQFLADKLRNLPVPDENKAWEEMKKLLEEKDDDRPLLPPFLKGCLPWIIGALLIGAGALLWNNFQNQKPEVEQGGQVVRSAPPPEKKLNDSTSVDGSTDDLADTTEMQFTEDRQTNPPVNIEGEPVQRNLNGPGERNERSNLTAGTNERSTSIPDQKSVSIERARRTADAERTSKSKSSDKGRERRSRSVTGNMRSSINTPRPQEDEQVSTLQGEKKVVMPASSKEVDNRQGEDSADIVVVETKDVADELTKSDSTEKEPEMADSSLSNPIAVDSTSAPQDSSSKKKSRKPFTFAAGLAFNQHIPINGAKPVAYDVTGRKGSLADYIPSIYFRALKPRWFIQGEFRYGAPNSVKEFVYSSKTVIDTFQMSTTSTKSLKKTFYHQVPLTFHYFVTKNWSVGAGIAYNKFTRAVRQEDVRFRIPGTTIDSLISSNLVQDGKDSAFVTHSFQWIAVTQYRWRRFSLGLRFAQGLQPYIKYTDPATGLPAEKRNQSLNAFLRYDLWRSKKK